MKESLALGKSAATTASAVLFGKVFTILVSGISFILVARILGPSSYGVYAVSVAVAAFFVSLSDFGIGTTFSKFIGEYSSGRDRKRIAELLANGYLIIAAIGLLSSLLVFALSGFFASYALHNAAYAYVLQVAAFTIIMSVLSGASYSALVGFGLSKELGFAVAIQIAVQAVFSISLALAGMGPLAPVLGLLLGFAASSAFELQAIFRHAAVLGARVSFKAMRQILGFAAPLAVSNIVSNVMYNATIVVLGAFAAASVVGDFGIVQRASSFVGPISESIGIAILPMFAAHLARNANGQRSGAFYNYAVYIAFLFIAPIVLYVLLLSVPFTVTVFSGVYAHASLYVAIMSIGVLIGIAGTYAMNLLTSANKVALVTKCTAAVAVVQLVSLAVLVPRFQGTGAVVQMFIVSPLASTAVFLYAVRRSLDVRLNIARMLRVILAGAVSAAFILPLIYLLDSYVLLLAAAAVEQFLLYPPLLALTRAVRRRDLDTLKRVSGSVPIAGRILGALLDYSGAFCPVS